MPSTTWHTPSATGKLYATISGSHATLGNTLTVIDPSTGAIGPSTWIGSEPRKIAVSDDGSTLYVGLDGTGSIVRVDATTLGTSSPISLGREPTYGPHVAAVMAVAPGDPTTVAVLRTFALSVGAGVAIFTNGIMRSKTSVAHPAATALTFGATGGRLYDDSGDRLVRMTVDASGIASEDMVWSLLRVYARLAFQNGRLYQDAARVVDPETATVAGTFPFTDTPQRRARRGARRGLRIVPLPPLPCSSGTTPRSSRASIPSPSRRWQTRPDR